MSSDSCKPTYAPRIPSNLRPNPNAFANAPKSFATTSPRPNKQSILITQKHPNVLDVETSRDVGALKQLLHRNEGMLLKTSFIASLPDKGAKLQDMNTKIRKRVEELESGEAAPPSPKKHVTLQSNRQQLFKGDIDADMDELHELVEGIQLNKASSGMEDVQSSGQNDKTAGGIKSVPTELNPLEKVVKVKTLSFEETVFLGNKHAEDERILQATLASTAGTVPVKKMETTFDKSKYRSAVGPLPEEDSDFSSDEEEEDEEYYDDG
ncbi:hypothetical protein HDU79_000030 [Rhizoclosmatium sp. JEL0117]|nr:hypothetical protein HDU79_000030 [Rhizoclosmatium sp. JEL0117]